MKRTILKALSIILIIGLAAGAFAGCGTKSPAEGNSGGEAQKPVIKVGTKDFTENLILGELYALALEDNGYQVDRVFNIASSVVHTSLVNGDVDLYPEYTGTGLLAVLKLPLETDPQTVYDTVKTEYESQFDLVWLDYAQANDGQGLVITAEASEKYGIKTISDLQKNADKLRFASQGEFDVRDDGIPALEAKYGKFNWASSKVYDNSLKYEVLANGEADVAPAYTTEGRLVDERFTLLEDDKYVWPPYNIAPVVSKAVLDAAPDIADILNAVNAKIDTKTITALNAQVDVDKLEYEDVAKDFYDSIQ
ncbi:MAG: Substrate-binding region of ABC-type glycine betaine transport system [Bacillota bacterium]|jgi:osmoprotectant transport system substrate-binding protein|nr:Substrate-binding region of ABC-type glycine betaine transport system [Bacillota bacterium]